jgi:hypothetical protein
MPRHRLWSDLLAAPRAITLLRNLRYIHQAAQVGARRRVRARVQTALYRARPHCWNVSRWLVVFAVLTLVPLTAWSQSASAPTTQPSAQSNVAGQTSSESQAATPPRVIAFAELQSSYSSVGIVGTVDVDAGFTLTDQIAADVGLPLILTRSPFSPVLNRDYYWSGAMGEPYFDVRYTRSIHHADFTSLLTATLPFGNEEKTFTTGRVGVDWFNHVEEKWGLLTPFLNVGASNGAVNRYIMPRPFTEARPFQSLGFLSDFEAGSNLRLPWLFKGFSLGASAYATLPVGPQKIFSRLVLPYSALGDFSEGSVRHHRVWDQRYETVGHASLSRDNGYSGWLDIARFHPFDLQLGYVHSVHFALDTYTLTLTFDGRNLVKKITGY